MESQNSQLQAEIDHLKKADIEDKSSAEIELLNEKISELNKKLDQDQEAFTIMQTTNEKLKT